MNGNQTGSPQTASARGNWQPELGQDYATGMRIARETRRQRAAQAAASALVLARQLAGGSAPPPPGPPAANRTGLQIMADVRESWRRQFPGDPPGAY